MFKIKIGFAWAPSFDISQQSYYTMQAQESAFKVFVLPIMRIQLVALAEQDIHGQGPAQQYVQSDKCETCTFQHLVYFNFGA